MNEAWWLGLWIVVNTTCLVAAVLLTARSLASQIQALRESLERKSDETDKQLRELMAMLVEMRVAQGKKHP